MLKMSEPLILEGTIHNYGLVDMNFRETSYLVTTTYNYDDIFAEFVKQLMLDFEDLSGLFSWK